MKKRILSILLSLVMLLSLLPTAAFATAGNFDPCNGGAKIAGASAETAPATDPTWGDYIFAGWYDARTGGTEVTGSFNTGTTYYAHWWTNEDEDTLVLTEGLLIGSDGNLYVGNASSPVSFTNPDAYGLGYSSGTLTMNNAVIDTCDGFVNGTVAVGVLYQDTPTELTIALTGDNVVRVDTITPMDQTHGVDVTGALTLDGTGSLTVTAGNATSASYGVHSSGTLTNKATLTATAGDAAEYSSGVQVSETNNLVNNAGAELTAFGGEVGKSDAMTLSTGVRCEQGSLTNNGTLNATSGNCTDGNSGSSSCGIYCPSGTLTNGENAVLTGTAGEVAVTGGMSFGVYCKTTLTNNGTLTGNGGEASGASSSPYAVSCSFGVYCEGSLTNGTEVITDAQLTGNGGEASGEDSSSGGVSCGDMMLSLLVADVYNYDIVNYGTLTGMAGIATGEDANSLALVSMGNITNSNTLIAAADEAKGTSEALGCTGLLTNGAEDNPEAEITATASDSGMSIGAECSRIKNYGTMNVTTGDGNQTIGAQCASMGPGEFWLKNYGTMEITAGDATGNMSMGIMAQGTVTNSGTLTATAGAAGNASCGIMAQGTVTNSGTLTGRADSGAMMSYGVNSSGTLTVTEDGAVISYGDIGITEGYIDAMNAVVVGANGVNLINNTTTSSLTRSGSNPIIITFAPLFDLCDGSTILIGTKQEETFVAPTNGVEWKNYIFDGWYTQRTGGEEVTGDYQKGVFYYAHWENAAGNTVLTEGLRIQEEGLFTYSLNDHKSYTLANANKYGLTYDGTTKTLTMDNAVIDTYDGLTGDSTCAALYATSELTVELKGENALYLGKGTGVRAALYIEKSGGKNDLTLTGEGTLIAEAGATAGSSSKSYGVYCGDFINQATLTATAGGTTYQYGKSSGVYCTSLDNDGTLTATAGKGSSSYGVNCSDGTITNDGTLNATGGGSNGGSGESCGVYCEELTNNKTLTAEGGKGESSYGVSCVTLENKAGAALTATAGESTGESGNSLGVVCTNLTNAGTLEATGKETKCGSCGVCCYESLTNAGSGTLKAWGGEANGEYGFSFGVCCEGDVSITNDGTLEATGGAATVQSVGVFFAGVSLTNNGMLKAWGGSATGEGSTSYGVNCGNGTITNNGTLKAKGDEGIGEGSTSYGMGCYGESLTNNGTLTVTADEADSGSIALDCIALLTNGAAVNASATITAIASDSAAGSIGIYCRQAYPLVNYGTLTAETGNGGQTYGVQCEDEIENYGIMKITAGDASVTSYGLLCTGDLTNGTETNPAATLTAKAGNSTASDSTGVMALGTIYNYGTLTATAGDANASSLGVVGQSSATGIENYGTLTGRAGAADASFGVTVTYKDLTVYDGAVISYGDIKNVTGGGYIIADGAVVSGADETFKSGETASLTQKTSGTPIIITLGALFDPCNGDPLIASLTAPDPDPTKDGYDFDDWYTAADGGDKVTSGFVAGTTYYGHWTEKTATLTYNANGHGTAPDSVTMTYAAAVNAAAAITATGYTFTGWNTKDDGTGTAYAAGAVVKAANTDPTATTLYAQWTALQTTVTLNKKGGTGGSDSVTATYGAAMPSATMPTKTGYTFDGYFDAETSGTKYYNADGTSAKAWDKEGASAALYAQWTENTATLTYDANGHGTAPEAVTMKYTEATNAAAALTATGYTFTGWNTESNGTGTAYAAGAEVKAANTEPTAITLYAQWTANSTPSSSGGGSNSSYAITTNTAKNGSISVDKKNASSGSTVTITVTPDKGFTLETLTALDKNGKEIEVKSLGNNKFSFKMPSGKVTVSATFMEDNTMLNFFVDVKATDYFCDAVLWAAENGITKGTDAVHFSPNAPVTRAQVVTFLWRAAGKPVVNYAMNMSDVKSGEYYSEAVRWALSEGITKGTSATMFSPDAVCTRGQIVTFLARFAGVKDEATGYTHGFTDVKAADYFNNAVAWAKDNKVTEGTSATTFSPNTNCTRAQVVTFLYRWMVK